MGHKAGTPRTDEQRAQARVHAARWRAKNKKLIIEGYGGRCVCCGVDAPVLLCIDHVEGGGRKDYAKMNSNALYSRIIAAGYPPEYQLLCWNCNSYKHINGTLDQCPCIKNITKE